MEAIKVTASQYIKMDEKITQLQNQLQQALIERDKAKSSDGDRSENSALDAAENEVTIIQAQLDQAIRNYRLATVVNNIDTSKVNVLTQVKTRWDDGQERWLSIVDVGQGTPPSRVSINSKLGSAIKGHIVGDKVVYQDNRFRMRSLEILEIIEDQ